MEVGQLKENECQEQLERMKENFIANISHELGTPLASIKGFTSTLLSEENMDKATQKRFLKIIEEETDNLAKLINRVINLSRYEQQNIKDHISMVNIVLLAREALNSFDAEIRTNAINATVEAPEVLIVEADEQGIAEVFSQLISNAVKYSEKGGKIAVVAEDRPDEAFISVTDHGCGIHPEDLPHIFEKFYKAENPIKRMGGIGVGLSLAARIIEKHGGRIWAESEIRKGTRISFVIPKKI
jgi:two-component system, OmpR family, phosphate regulon sensor histidine kinase PhoR